MDAVRTVLVEDDVNTCTLMDAFFKTSAEVTLCGIAHDGEEGLELIRLVKPELVLLDLIMPRRSGLSVIDILKSDVSLQALKIVVITHLSNEESIRRVLAMGVNYYLIKPVNFSELQRMIRLLFEEVSTSSETTSLAEWLLREMKADEHTLGFRYTAAATEALANYTSGRRMLLKEAYYGMIHDDQTSYSCVEKNIRATVRNIHAAGANTYRDLMGGLPDQPPKNSEFLPRLADRLRKMTNR